MMKVERKKRAKAKRVANACFEAAVLHSGLSQTHASTSVYPSSSVNITLLRTSLKHYKRASSLEFMNLLQFASLSKNHLLHPNIHSIRASHLHNQNTAAVCRCNLGIIFQSLDISSFPNTVLILVTYIP